MKTVRWMKIIGMLIIVLGLFRPLQSHAQIPPFPTDPYLDSWSFYDPTNWYSDLGYAPIGFTNIICDESSFASDDGVLNCNGLILDSTNAAFLSYKTIQSPGNTNVLCQAGTIWFWFSSDWDSESQGGMGPGNWGDFIDVGAWTSNAVFGYWGLSVDPAGDNIYFSGQTNGASTNYLSYPISWNAGSWHLIGLTYTPTNSILYVDGQFATNGIGVIYPPSRYVLTNSSFSIGSDGLTGMQQARGEFVDVETWSDIYSVDDFSNYYAQMLPEIGGIGFGGFGGADFSPPDLGGGGGGGGGFTNIYGTNLWLYIAGVQTNTAGLFLINTEPDISYEIQSKTDLLLTNWNSEGFVLGSEITNWMEMDIAQGDRTNNLFMRIRSWQSSDGSGLPDWWELQYFGITGIDPNALDSAGDGWTIYQKFQMGLNPNVFSTPPAPQGLVATINPTNSAVTLTWQPATGAVTGYTIGRFDDVAYAWTYYTVGVTNQFVDTNYPAYTDTNLYFNAASQYEIQADYALGNSSGDNYASPYSVFDVPYVLEMPGAGGSTALLVTHIPSDASSLRLVRTDNSGTYSTTATNIPVSAFTNGAFTIPTNIVFTAQYGSTFQIQVVRPDGSKSSAVNAGQPEALFYDGRTQMEQNVSFLLQAASLTNSFAYVLDGASTDYQVNEPTNYTYASYYDVSSGSGSGLGDVSERDWTHPFDENYRYRNFLYINTTNLDSSGFLNTGCSVDEDGNYSLQVNPVFQLIIPTNSTTIPALAASTLAQPYNSYQPLGMYVNGSSQFVLPSNIYNYFGLHLSAVLIAHAHAGTLYLDTLSAGGTWPATNDTYYFYPQFDQPELETTGYYFGRMYDQWTGGIVTDPTIPGDPLPGNSNFSPTNAQPLLIVGMGGQPVQIAAFAKKIVLNGDTNKPVYVAQYFDKAYKVDTNGVVTTNTTGVLSAWGDFQPTEPSPVALVTMPDINTGQRGTDIVQVVSLQLDANHDGNMDLNYFGQDFTSGNPDVFYGVRAFEFWINNGDDEPASSGLFGNPLDHDVQVQGGIPQNSSYGQIRCQRNLENFARLWICGLTNLPPNQGYTATLGLDQYAPEGCSLNLYPAYESDGGTKYLTDTNVAASQLSVFSVMGTPVIDYGSKLATINSSQSYTLPMDGYGNLVFTHFLFEGGDAGVGSLVLTISKNGQPIAQAYAYLDLHDIKDFYERAAITNNMSGAISNWSSTIETVQSSTAAISSDEDSNIIVYVHGGDNGDFSWRDRSDTLFKRLYWSGYNGKVATVRWPSPLLGLTTLLTLDTDWFNRSELIAYKSASALKDYLNQLHSRFPNYQLNLLPQSLGGAIVSEAIKEGAPFDTLILCQNAMSASCYDVNAPTNADLISLESSYPTTDWQPMGYHGVYTNFANRVVSYFNTNDVLMDAWLFNQETFKPPGSDYSFVGTNVWNTSASYQVTDPQESRAMFSRSRTLAIGNIGPASGQTSQGVIQSAIDLHAQFNIQNSLAEHSAFYTRPIQTIWPLYDQILESCLIPTIQR